MEALQTGTDAVKDMPEAKSGNDGHGVSCGFPARQRRPLRTYRYPEKDYTPEVLARLREMRENPPVEGEPIQV